jgi:hypothetical protein
MRPAGSCTLNPKQVHPDETTNTCAFSFVYHNEKSSDGFTNVHRVMIRIAIAIVIFAAVACSRASSLTDRQPHHSVAADSNYVSDDELWEDVRQGHTVLYDALRSTRAEMLRSESEREGLEVFFDNPLGFAHGPFRVSILRTVSTAQVKWIRRYAPGTAPAQLDYDNGVLLVALR